MDHAALVEALKTPSFYPHPVDAVESIQTHISSVFLTGEYAYKLKKRKDFGFLDFTTLEQRQRYCAAEVELNRRLAPETYLRAAPITLDDGVPTFDGTGEIVDWVVVMRQLDGSRLGPAVHEAGELGEREIDQLVDVLVPFYEHAATGPAVDQYGREEVVKFNTDENFAQTEPFVGEAISRRRFDEIRAFTNRFYEEHGALFERRISEGRIRESHGDLHLGNIFFLERPVIFDCIEFNERFRCGDVAVDLAFLAMDLDFRRRSDLSERLIQSYVQRSGDHELLDIIDFYMCYRAYVRGKIACFLAADRTVDAETRTAQISLARRYFGLAHRYTRAESKTPALVFYGLMGTGSTTLARHLHDETGWEVLSTDPIRKELAGVAADERVYIPWGEGLYSPEMTARVYEEILRRAESLLAGGFPVILDGSFKRRNERQPVLDLAARERAQLLFVRTDCEPEEQRRRLEERQSKTNVSDGRVELIASQRKAFEDPAPEAEAISVQLTTDGTRANTRAALHAILVEHGLLTAGAPASAS